MTMEVASHGQCYSKVSLGNPLPATTIYKRHALGKKRVPLKRRVVLHHAVRIHSQAGFGRGTVKIKEEEEELESKESEPLSGTKKLFKLPLPSNLPGAEKLQNKNQQSQPKTNRVVFVAGATGKVGSRTVRELLKLGFSVRASTRNVEKAQALFEVGEQSSSNDAAGSNEGAPFGIFSPAKLFGFLKPKAAKKRLEIVECDLENPESIEIALGNAGVVVCCIGASEKEVLDVSGPYRIDFKATDNLIKAASSADISHFVLVTSLGTQKFGFPAAVLNLFWGVLVWKAKAEKALIQSGIPYTIVRPGGMERPTDAYKETHNLTLAEADKLFGGQVSNLQVAELLASIVENADVSVNKIVEAIAETTAPLRPIRELLEEIPAKEASSRAPQSIRNAKPATADVNAQKASKKQEEEKVAEEKRLQAQREKEEQRILAQREKEEQRILAQREKEEKRIQAERDAKEKNRLQDLRKRYEEEIEAAREREEAANSAAAAALAEKAELEKKAAEIRAKAEAAALAASQAKAVEAAVLAAARKGEVLSDEEKEKIAETVRLARLPKEAAPVEQIKPNLKKPPFSFMGKAAPSSIVAVTETKTEPTKKEETEKVKVDAKSEVKAKADKKAVADKRQEEETLKKEEEAKKLAEAKKKEEQERLEKEATERAEKEAKERAEREATEAKLKEEAETKQKEEAEAKKKEEEERRRKEAEQKAEAEAIRREEEEKVKREAEAEAKRKKEELVEAKKKEEEEKAKKEAEMLKAEAEEKARALAEQEAAKQAATVTATEEVTTKQEVKEARSSPLKGFRWFWQPAEPETPDVQESTEEEVADVPVNAEVSDQLPPCPTPLSPFTRYPGLKPPSPPIASPPAPKAQSPPAPKTKSSRPTKAEKMASTIADVVSSEVDSKDRTTAKVELPPQEEPAVVTKEPSEDSKDDFEARKRQIQETEAREREALEKAQAATSFKWFWQKFETTGEESVSTSNEEEPAAAIETASSVPEEPATLSEQQTNKLPPSSRPLSPYTQFPNLKPPSPPKAYSAPQNGSAASSKPVETLARSSTPLSPYPGFPDFKPPTSPAPLAGNGAMPATAVEQEEEEAAESSSVNSGFKWPWQQ